MQRLAQGLPLQGNPQVGETRVGRYQLAILHVQPQEPRPAGVPHPEEMRSLSGGLVPGDHDAAKGVENPLPRYGVEQRLGKVALLRQQLDQAFPGHVLGTGVEQIRETGAQFFREEPRPGPVHHGRQLITVSRTRGMIKSVEEMLVLLQEILVGGRETGPALERVKPLYEVKGPRPEIVHDVPVFFRREVGDVHTPETEPISHVVVAGVDVAARQRDDRRRRPVGQQPARVRNDVGAQEQRMIEHLVVVDDVHRPDVTGRDGIRGAARPERPAQHPP